MSDNDFTTAARAHAESLSPLHGYQELVILGASWARDHLAAQEPTDAESVELRARIKAVRLIHDAFEDPDCGTVCGECSEFSGDYGLYPVMYPCDTLRILDGEVLKEAP